MDICIAKETEYQRVIDFYHELITKMQPYPYHPTWIIGTYPEDDYLKQLTANGQVFWGLEDHRIAASMVLNQLPNEGYKTVPWQVSAADEDVTILHLLGVLPEYWGRGFGKELLDYAERFLRAKGQKALRLDVMEENLPARRLYEQNGFREIETIRMFYESTGWSGFTMYEKDLERRSDRCAGVF